MEIWIKMLYFLSFSIFGPLSETTADQDAVIGVISRAAAAKHEAAAHTTKYRDRYSNFPATATERTKKNHYLYRPMYTVQDNIITAEDHTKRTATVVGVDRMRYFNETDHPRGSRAKRQDVEPCDKFKFRPGMTYLTHPSINGETYTPKKDCFSLIATDPGKVIILDFVDVFHIEYHPICAYDYLEIRDGMHGYSMLINKYCGNNFPPRIQSTGPYLWLKFHSDDTIEYEGFKISIRFEASATSKSIPVSCYINKTNEDRYGIISLKEIPDDCKQSNPMDVLWNITTPKNTKIHLNFTAYKLKFINDCTKNYIQIFEGKPVMDNNIAMYCGSVANPKTTKGSDEDDGNVLLVRLYLESEAKDEKVEFNATFTAFRTLNTKNNERCDPVTEFDCEDNTCIEAKLECDDYAHCRLKADEHDKCKAIDESMIQQPHILVILVIFSLILSGMSFVFLFKCIKKLVEDHKAIKKHLQESCEERLDEVIEKSLESARSSRSRQRASSERENHANELFKRRHMSPHQPTSIDSDFIQETHLDLDEEIWRRDVESLPIDPEDVRIEHNGRTRKKDISRKEESMRKDSRSTREREEDRERKEIRDVSVGAPDTKESGCQTRESLFQAGTAASSDVISAGGTDSGSGARGFSTFGYSGATLARPSPAPPVESSQITIELLRGHQDSQSRKSDRRPMSSETTRSAPDVIIVSKPIR